jgi:hypothetical protein
VLSFVKAVPQWDEGRPKQRGRSGEGEQKPGCERAWQLVQLHCVSWSSREADDFKFRRRIDSRQDLIHAAHRLVFHFDFSALAALEDR